MHAAVGQDRPCCACVYCARQPFRNEPAGRLSASCACLDGCVANCAYLCLTPAAVCQHPRTWLQQAAALLLLSSALNSQPASMLSCSTLCWPAAVDWNAVCLCLCVCPSCRFADLEVMLSEAGRARGLYELAISQPVLDMPEAVWKAYIDFEISQVRGRGERDRERRGEGRGMERDRERRGRGRGMERAGGGG